MTLRASIPMSISTRAAHWLSLAGLSLVLGACAGGVHAQALPSGVTLGMDEAALRAALPELSKVRRPHRSPGGALASWRLPGYQAGAFWFEETFYLQGQGLRQVELLLLPRQPGDAGAAAFAGMVDQLRVLYGPALAASSPPGPGFIQESASWTVDDQDIIATRSGNPQNPTVRFVWRLRVTPDASEL